MAATKEAIALILDVSPSMENAPPGSSSPLEKSLKAINMIIQRKIFSKSKDEIALIAFGTAETNNPLAEQCGGYDNVTVVRDLGPPDTELLQTVNNIQAGPAFADFIDAIIVAMDHLMQKIIGRKIEPRIVLFSDLSSEFGTDKLDSIVNSMKDHKIQLTFIGPEIPDEDDNSTGNGQVERPRNNSSNHDSKPLSSQQLKGINCLKSMLEQTDGEGMSFAEVLPMLSFFQTRSIKQTTVFRGPLEIGDSLKINMYGYVKVKELKSSSWGKVSALSEISKNPGSMKVTMQRSNHMQDEDATEVDEENISKAYRYGKTLVPYSKVEQQNSKLQTEKCLKVLGFTDRRNLDSSQFIGESVYMFVPEPGDSDAAVAASALAHALEEKDMVVIVRYCRCKNAAPKLAFLEPIIKVHYEGFQMHILPFSEDIRRYPFASLENIDHTGEQLNAIDSLIDGMDLTRAIRNEDGDFVEAFKPRDTLNPTIQRQCQCVQHRALNPGEDTLPEMEDYIKRLTEPVPEQAANSAPVLDKIKELFPLKTVEKANKRDAVNVFMRSDEKDEPDEKKAKPDHDEQDDHNFNYSALASAHLNEVGTVDPIGDYRSLIKNANHQTFRDVSLQLSDRIIQLVNDSFLDQYYKKALDCLKALREACFDNSAVEIFNTFLKNIKDTMMGQRRNEFWELIKAENVSLITANEDPLSNVTEEEGAKFFGAPKSVVKEESLQQDEEDVDDLLDLM